MVTLRGSIGLFVVLLGGLAIGQPASALPLPLQTEYFGSASGLRGAGRDEYSFTGGPPQPGDPEDPEKRATFESATARALSEPRQRNIELPGGTSRFGDLHTFAEATNPGPQFMEGSLATSTASVRAFGTFGISSPFRNILPTAEDDKLIVNGVEYRVVDDLRIRFSANAHVVQSFTGNANASGSAGMLVEFFDDVDRTTGALSGLVSRGVVGGNCNVNIEEKRFSAVIAPSLNAQSSGNDALKASCEQGEGFNSTMTVELSSGLSATDVVALFAFSVPVPQAFRLNLSLTTTAQAAAWEYVPAQKGKLQSQLANTGPCAPLVVEEEADSVCKLSAAGANSAKADANDTFGLTSIEIIDSNGTVLPFFEFTTLDWFSLPSAAPVSSPVPEPSSISVVLAGIFALRAWTSRRRGRRAPSA